MPAIPPRLALLTRLAPGGLAALVLACPSAPVPEPLPDPPTPAIDDDDDDDSAVSDDDDSALPPCDPALALTPDEASAVAIIGLITVTPSGGTGAWDLALTTNASDAQFNPSYGTWLAGPTLGVDVVTLTDRGCEGSALALLTVVPGLDVAPRTVELPPGFGFDVSVAGGSGDWSCALALDGSGATVLPPCRYDAGPNAGSDLLRVTDDQSGETVDVSVAVVPGATLLAAPSRIHIPVGSDFALTVQGGSGFVTASGVTGTSVSLTDGILHATSPGPTTMTLLDDYTGQSTTLEARGVGALQGGFARAGDNFVFGDTAAADLDGDGWLDLVLGLPEIDTATYNDGVVRVYLGGPDGLDVSPAWEAAGDDYEDRLGYAVAVGEVTGDGAPDLLVAAYLSDRAGADAGEVRLYAGVPGGLFADEPAHVFTGDHVSDQFGGAITTCDLNGDGWGDLAVGAGFDEDRSVQTQAVNQGAVWIYLGGPAGLPDAPNQVLYGSLPDAQGAWAYASTVNLGTELASGDLNGDGLCDLAVGAFEFNPPNEVSTDGAVFLYLGADDLGTSTGVFGLPVAAWAALDPFSRDSNFGRAMDAGDVDGDGLADLLVGQYRENVVGVSGSRHGAVRLFLGGPYAAVAATELLPVDSADWTMNGDGSFDSFGWEVRLHDQDGDGLDDVIVGGFSAEPAGGVNDGGAVQLWAGVQGGLPGPTPTWARGGGVGGDLFGTRLELLDDADADGLADLFVYAARAEEQGIHVGSPWWVPSDLAAPFAMLDNPGASSGQRQGESVAVVGDVNSDGWEDALVGVPNYDDAGHLNNAGLAQLFFGGPNGLSATPLAITGFERYSDADWWGWNVAGAGDFNGDGLDDFALVGRFEDRPATFPATVVGPVSCAGAVNNAGAVAVFLGVASGVPSAQPAFLWFSREADDTVQNLAGGFDLDGDGFSDLIVGGHDWDSDDGRLGVGGVEILYGRPEDAAGITVLCHDGPLIEGFEAGGRLGRGLAGLGDVDADGCDDVAIGAFEEDFGVVNQGVVRILWGFGAGCGVAEPEVSLLVPQDSSARAGYALAGGEDVDGDGVPDLVVGAHTRSLSGNSTGGVWLVPGSYLQSLPREAFVHDVAPQAASPMSPVGGGPWALRGTVQDEQLGFAVALVPGIGPGGAAGLAVGSPRGDVSGTARAGGALIYLFDGGTGGLDPVPWAAFGGESFTPNGRVGEQLAAGTIGGRPALLVGGYRASTWGPAQGAAWLVDLGP